MPESNGDFFIGPDESKRQADLQVGRTKNYTDFLLADLAPCEPDSPAEVIEAYLEQVVMRQEFGAFCAAHQSMLDVLLKDVPADEQFKLFAETRLLVIKDVWLRGRWQPPYSDLVNHVFPGAPLTEADIDGFMYDAPDQVEQQLHRQNYLADTLPNLKDTLWKGKYVVGENDEAVLCSLARLFYGVQTHASDPLIQVGAEIILGEAMRRIQRGATSPDHPVWEDVLRQLS